jgi:hypothetical protein
MSDHKQWKAKRHRTLTPRRRAQHEEIMEVFWKQKKFGATRMTHAVNLSKAYAAITLALYAGEEPDPETSDIEMTFRDQNPGGRPTRTTVPPNPRTYD